MFCAGGKNKVNLKDTLFAGDMAHRLGFDPVNDSSTMAHKLYLEAGHDFFSFLKNSSHFQRLSKFGVLEDIEFSLKKDTYNKIPAYSNERIELI